MLFFNNLLINLLRTSYTPFLFNLTSFRRPLINKPIFFYLLLFMFVLSLGGCSSPLNEKMQFSAIEDIKFSAAVPSAYAVKGYTAWAETENAVYYFSHGTDFERTQLVRRAEIILHIAGDQYNNLSPLLPSATPTICFSKETIQYDGNGRTSGVEINPDDDRHIGLLMYFMSSGQLPAWLSAGLELYYLEEYDSLPLEIDRAFDGADWFRKALEADLPAFGDAWFVPGFVQSELSENISSLSYTFVKYLDNTKQLPKIVSLYLDADTRAEAEHL